MDMTNLFRKLRNIMIMDDFMDVTLVCDDRTEFRAHRNILSAFSSVLQQLFQLNTKSNQSVVFLRGIKKHEMESILKFIYLGEVSFNQSRMDEFLAVAEILDIKELKESIAKPQNETLKEDALEEIVDVDDVDFEENDTIYQEKIDLVNSKDQDKDELTPPDIKKLFRPSSEDGHGFLVDDTQDEKEEPFVLVSSQRPESASPSNKFRAKERIISKGKIEEEDNSRVLKGAFTTDLLIKVLDRVTIVIQSKQISWEKLSKRHFKNEVILPMIETGILPPKKKGLKDYSSVWNKRIQSVYYSYLKNTIDWVTELTNDEAMQVRDYLNIIKDVSKQYLKHSKESADYFELQYS